jgi:tetratricopeptide (TPR) repeat protein
MRLIIALCVLASPAFAAECPAVPDHTVAVDSIIADLRIARDQTEASQLTDVLWRIWMAAPDEAAQTLLNRGMQKRVEADYTGSTAILDELVAYCPKYAEGYNQRAFTKFMAQDYAAAIADIDAALAIEPHHLGALTGKVLSLIGLDRMDEAQVILRQALALNPYLSERRLLIEPEGEDI